MKKIIAVSLLFLVSGFAFAEFKKDTGYLGFGVSTGVSDGFSNYSGDLFKYSGFLGYGFEVLGPIYVGVEGQFSVQKIGSDSSTSTAITNQLYTDGYGGYWSLTSVSQYRFDTNFWNIDLSPRVFAAVNITDSIQALGFVGLNFNSITYDSTRYYNQAGNWVVDDNSVTGTGNGDPKNSGNLYSAKPQVVVGLRGTFSIVYLEYTRYIDTTQDKNISWNSYASDRITLGLNLRW